MIDLGIVTPGKTIRIPFSTFDSNDPQASSAISAFVVGDIKVHKDGGTTERASTAGFTATTSFDTLVGINFVGLDLSDNTTAGFYSAGSEYFVTVADVTLDAATVRKTIGRFEIGYSGAFINTTIATLSTQTSFTLTDGPAENDALNGCDVLIHDVASGVQVGRAVISDYVGSTKTVTLAAATTFTVAATDNISIFRPININSWNTVDLATTNPLPNAAADAAGGLPISDAGGLDLDTMNSNIGTPSDLGSGATLSNNLLDIDGHVGNLASGSAAISTVAESYTLTTGTQSSGLYTDTEAEDGTNHEHTDAAGVMELYYQFDVGGNGVASEIDMTGYLTSSNDSLNVFAYDWAGAAWEQVGTLGGSSATNSGHKYNLTISHTGTGANLGKVRLRFYAASGLTSATLAVDRITCSYAVVTQSVGYDGGQVWVDTVAGTAGTESFVNGVADNPVSTWADALTIASNVGLSAYRAKANSSITLAATFNNSVLSGADTALALGGQDVSGSHFFDMDVTGTGTGSDEINFHSCHINAVTLAQSHFYNCGFTSTLTLSSAADYIIADSYSEIAGSGSPTIDMGAAVGATNLAIRNWSGGLTISNLAAGDVVTLDGVFGTITLNGADASVEIRGIAKAVVNNLTGSPTVNDDSLKEDDIASILADTNELQTDDVPGLIAALNNISTTDVNTQVSDVLKTDTIAEMAQQAPPATPTFEEAVMYLYMALRNKLDVTSTLKEFHNDAGTVIWKKTLSDDGTTYSEAEGATGP